MEEKEMLNSWEDAGRVWMKKEIRDQCPITLRDSPPQSSSHVMQQKVNDLVVHLRLHRWRFRISNKA